MGHKIYSDHGPHWWDKVQKEEIIYPLTVKKILPLIKGRKGKLLDIGCGYGHVTAMLAEHTKMQVIGTDYEQEMINEAKKKFKRKNLSFRRENAFDIKGEYDVVVSTGFVSV